MFHRLRRCEKSGVEGRGAFVFLHDLRAFLGDADDCIACLACGFLSMAAKTFSSCATCPSVSVLCLAKALFSWGACAAFSILGSVIACRPREPFSTDPALLPP